jgi:signal transduction histidine kinase
MSEVKEISYNLRPYQLDRIGLNKAIETLLKSAEAASGIRFVATIDDLEEALPKESEINFYRIAQECVNNILKHSQATEATVTIRRLGNRLKVTIQDNGKGFTPGAQGNAHGFGLQGIAERAQLLGGEAVIHSSPGHGATTTLEITLRPGSAQNAQ